MLLRRVLVALGLQHLQCLDQLLAGFARLDDGVDIPALGGDVGIGEALAKLFDLLSGVQLRVLSTAVFQFALVDDVDCAFRAHDGDLGSRPGVVHVGADVF